MIRRATPADAKALSALSRTCFTQTFGHLYDPADLEAFLDEAYAPHVLRAELEDPNRATWLLFEDATDEAPIGYATACPAHLPHPDVAPGDVPGLMQAITAASAIAPCPINAFSRSTELIHSPPDLIRSLVRSVMRTKPSVSMLATSPVHSQPSSENFSAPGRSPSPFA